MGSSDDQAYKVDGVIKDESSAERKAYWDGRLFGTKRERARCLELCREQIDKTTGQAKQALVNLHRQIGNARRSKKGDQYIKDKVRDAHEN